MAKTAVPTIFCGFGSLMDIDKLIPVLRAQQYVEVLVL